MIKVLFKHIRTIYKHKKYVRQMCWKLGLFWQGIFHDLSKFSPAELKMCKYWNGKGSPHQACREEIGYSPSWMHHYHRNKHHFQFWWDEDEYGKIIPIKMPYKYMLESFCDMVGASKAYNPSGFTEQKVLDYWNAKCKGQRIQHPFTEAFMEQLITFYARYGEKMFVKAYKTYKQFFKGCYEHEQTLAKLFKI